MMPSPIRRGHFSYPPAFSSQQEARGTIMEVTVGIGLLGCGTVGASVAQRLLHEREAIERRGGVRFELRAVAIRDCSKPRDGSLDAGLFTRDARALVEDPRIDL